MTLKLGEFVAVKDWQGWIVRITEVHEVNLETGPTHVYEIDADDETREEPYYEDEFDKLDPTKRIFRLQVHVDGLWNMWAIGDTAPKAKTWVLRLLDRNGWSDDTNMDYSNIASCRVFKGDAYADYGGSA